MQNPDVTHTGSTGPAIWMPFYFLQSLLGGHVARVAAAGLISGDEADRWWSELAGSRREGTFLYGFTAFIVAGSKS
ncbi:MAG TPA: hypothetical protein VIE44_05075 [Methylomirabilota bacterium]|jgi:hypothetical protein